MTYRPESWHRVDPHEEPQTLQEEHVAPVERGEDYKARTAKRFLIGEATEADVMDQAALAWVEEESDDELG